MKHTAFHFVLLAILLLFAQGTCNAEPAHPAKALYDECEAVRALAGNFSPRTFDANYALTIKACREKLLAYTLSHTGDDLDRVNWGNSYRSIYCISSQMEWRTYAESEASVRQAWEVLAQVKLENPQTIADLSLEVARWHIQFWSRRDPEVCAAFMDETEQKLLGSVSAEGLDGWKWVLPTFEQCFIYGANKLPPERRAVLWQRRDAGMMRQLKDETLSINRRSDILATYAAQLYSQGDPERAVPLMDAWWAKHGASITTSQFFSARFHTACYGTGDWNKARETLRRMDQLVAAGKISAEDGLYKLVTANYYKNIAHPPYELKRRAQIKNAEKKKNFLSIIW